MAHITLSKPTTSVVGGVNFVDGEADAPLGRNLRGYFEAIGATIKDGQEQDFPGVDSTKAEMAAYAEAHDIDVPAGTKAEILDTIQSTLDEE